MVWLYLVSNDVYTVCHCTIMALGNVSCHAKLHVLSLKPVCVGFLMSLPHLSNYSEGESFCL